jgi:retron-type reverse transcriptase
VAASFDNIDHDRLLAMLAERIDDQALWRLIGGSAV